MNVECNLKDKIKFMLIDFSSENQFEDNLPLVKYECRCNFKALSGKEYLTSKATGVLNVVSFRVRYCNAIKELINMPTTKFYIEHEKKKYNVVYILNVQNENSFVDFKAEVSS